MHELEEKLQELLDLYHEIKRDVRSLDRHLFERWKAGGFLIDEDIFSSYPNITEVVETLCSGCDDEDE